VQEEELDSCRAPASGGWIAGSGCREKPKRVLPARFCPARNERRQVRRPSERKGLGRFSHLGNWFGVLLGFGLSSKLLLDLEGDGVRVHLVHRGGIA